MDDIRITLADYGDVRSIVRLQRTLMLGTKGTQGGFLVSGFTVNDYRGFLDRGELILKATVGRRIVGAMMVFSSGSIEAGDVNNCLLKYTVRMDFHLVKQVFVAAEYARQGIARRFYNMLDDLKYWRLTGCGGTCE